MSEKGKFEVFNTSANKPIFTVDPDAPFEHVTVTSPNGAKYMAVTNSGALHLMNKAIQLDGSFGWLVLGGKGGMNPEIAMYDADNSIAQETKLFTKSTIHLRASDALIRTGGSGKHGKLMVFNADTKWKIWLDGSTGEIKFDQADCAEEFEVEDSTIEPGTVLTLGDQPGRLRISDVPYDTRVAGVLSGAGDYRPAIVLDRKDGTTNRRPIALMGKVACKVEAHSSPVHVGSLLTTSSLPGHAMAATDREQAFGAVLGKALAPLASGVGLVPVLVALQ